jgi:hypothetical protein
MRDIDDDLIHRLEEREASPRGRGAAPPDTAQAPLADRGSFAERAARWRARTAGRHATDSAELIGADRDRDDRA